MRRTKIVCTVGAQTIRNGLEPALSSLAEAGMDVLRMNLSYAGGTYDLERTVIQWARNHGYRVGNRVFALLGDLQGIKFRVRGLPNRAVTLTADTDVLLVDDDQYTGQPGMLPLPTALHQNLLKNLAEGQEPLKIYFGDGDIILMAEGLEGDAARCSVLVGGLLKEGKGITLQGIDYLPADPLTDKDKEDIRFLLKHGGVTFFALSFAQSGEDIRRVKRFMMEECGCPEDKLPPIVAKIETRRGWQNLDSILDEAYGVMVARGDLGLQVGIEHVAEIQKEIIYRCRLRARPVITATQMLESMEQSLEPKRAEASDIFNAVLDGTDAVMLSGETSAGRYPVQAVQTMVRILKAAESYLERHYQARPMVYLNQLQEMQEALLEQPTQGRERVAVLVSHAAAWFATTSGLPVRAIVTPSHSGSSCRLVSRFRPPVTVIGATDSLEVLHSLALSYGVRPVLIRTETGQLSELLSRTLKQAGQLRLLEAGELVVLCAGHPWQAGATNMLQVHTVLKEELVG